MDTLESSVHPQLRKLRISAPRSNSSSSNLSEGLALSNHTSTPPIAVPPPSTTLFHSEVNASGSFENAGRCAEQVSHSPPKTQEHIVARRPSITFHPTVKLETGHKIPLQTPAPKQPKSSLSASDFEAFYENYTANKPSPFSAYGYGGRYGQESATNAGNSYGGNSDSSFSSEKAIYVNTSRMRGSEQGRMNGNATAANEQVAMASLTSASTASPPTDEAKTPSSSGMDTFLSPIAAHPREASSFKDTESSPWPWGLNTTQRSKSFTTSRSQSRFARKSSAPSQMSPASMFLRGYRQPKAPDPDDEGQEIGNYVIGKTIGFGGFSIVKEAHTIENGVDVCRAVKIVKKQVRDKETENEAIQAEFEHEVNLWRHLSHPYVLDLISVYDTPFATFCITRFNIGGTLFDLVKKNRSGISPDLAQKYCFQLASALRYLHQDMHIVHRDVKLENVLLNTTAGDGGDILLCDFGLAEFLHSSQSDGDSDDGDDFDSRNRPKPKRFGPADTSSAIASSSTGPLLGSLQYAPPELIESQKAIFDTSIDMWAFGIVVYALHVGSLPFHHGLSHMLQAMIVEAKWDEGALAPKESPQCPGMVDVVKGCLEKDLESRLDVRQVLDSQWLERYGDLSP